VAFERQIRLPHEQQERGEFGLMVMCKLLDFEQAQSYDGSNYIVHQDEANERLTVTAKDGRGEILQCEGPYTVSAALTEEDVQVFKLINQELDLARQRQQQQQQEPQRQQQQSKKQSRGFEMD
jgi:hypothetical protein